MAACRVGFVSRQDQENKNCCCTNQDETDDCGIRSLQLHGPLPRTHVRVGSCIHCPIVFHAALIGHSILVTVGLQQLKPVEQCGFPLLSAHNHRAKFGRRGYVNADVTTTFRAGIENHPPERDLVATPKDLGVDQCRDLTHHGCDAFVLPTSRVSGRVDGSMCTAIRLTSRTW